MQHTHFQATLYQEMLEWRTIRSVVPYLACRRAYFSVFIDSALHFSPAALHSLLGNKGCKRISETSLGVRALLATSDDMLSNGHGRISEKPGR